MNALTNKKYYSKLLLFGEYAVINGGEALAIPFRRFFGQWKYGQSNLLLKDFLEFALKQENAQKDQLIKAISEDLYFDSSIPLGYGCGSSGALTAAVYDQFFTHKQYGTAELKRRLAEIESYFHGQSSGLDPLVSYLEKTTWLKDGDIHVLDQPFSTDNFFLIDSKKERETSHWVKIYLNKWNTLPEFKGVMESLNRYNSQAISAFLIGDHSNLMVSFKSISTLQRQYFEEMIPDNIKEIWDQGLKSNDFYLKLSGAGGGGYFLGIGQKPKNAMSIH